MTDNSCPICHGEKHVWYDEFSHRLPEPIPCRCCRETGLALYALKAADPARLAAIEAGYKGGAASVEQRRLNRRINARTLAAITSSTYYEYRAKCAAAGFRPSSSGAWRRLRVNWKDAPEYVPGKSGPRKGMVAR